MRSPYELFFTNLTFYKSNLVIVNDFGQFLSTNECEMCANFFHDQSFHTISISLLSFLNRY